MSDAKPKLRSIEFFEADIEGRLLIGLRDPEGLADATLLLPQEAVAVVSLFNGDRTIADVQEVLELRFGTAVPKEVLIDLLDELDTHFLLDNENFRSHLESLKGEWQEQEARDPAFAGEDYPDDPDELRARLSGLADEADPELEGSLDSIEGVWGPGVGFSIGEPGYGPLLDCLDRMPPPDTVVLLAPVTSSLSLFSLTDKPYRTPLGTSPIDEELLETVCREADRSPLDTDFLHGWQNALEFSVLCVQATLGTDVPILPVLCGSLGRFIAEGRSPEETGEYGSFLTTLQEGIDSLDRSVLYFGTGGLSQIGPSFGDSIPVDDLQKTAMKVADARLLKHLQNRNGHDFFRAVEADKNRRRISGLPAAFALLTLLRNEGPTSLLAYVQAFDDETESLSTCASLAFH